ncbi:MAG: hypothetical protein DME26_13150, partial [Verrucomicrobia bacterium]
MLAPDHRAVQSKPELSADAAVGITISLGILAWNEAEAIGATLESLFRQSLFAELARRGQRCEILCVTNGCTDQTPAIAANIFEAQSNHHPWKSTFTVRVVNVPERGKTNAWNLFVHSQSARTAGVLFLMDGDIVIREPNTIWNMYTALLNHPGAAIAIDQPLKDL